MTLFSENYDNSFIIASTIVRSSQLIVAHARRSYTTLDWEPGCFSSECHWTGRRVSVDFHIDISDPSGHLSAPAQHVGRSLAISKQTKIMKMLNDNDIVFLHLLI